jgi:hypothetical protein
MLEERKEPLDEANTVPDGRIDWVRGYDNRTT